MPAEIYNEGRVVGLSAYEIYVKQHLSEDPSEPVASERDWLASSLAMGASMILQFPKVQLDNEDQHAYIDIPLPRNSVLAAANTIVASFFDGRVTIDSAGFSELSVSGLKFTQSASGGWSRYPVEFSGGGWARNILDAQLVSNHTGNAATGVEPRYPGKGNSQFDDGGVYFNSAQHANVISPEGLQDWGNSKKLQLKSYMQIVDGVVIQPGKWFKNTDTATKDYIAADFSANLNKIGNVYSYPTLRFHIKGSIETEFPILFTGFTIRSVLSGITKTDSALSTSNKADGDFLGPSVFPWVNKIVFHVPNSFIEYFMKSGYVRKLGSETSSISVKDTSIVDMKSASGSATDTTAKLDAPVLENYYQRSIPESDSKLFTSSSSTTVLQAKHNSRVSDSVSSFSTLGDGTAVLTVYQKVSVFPPALYGTFVSANGQNYLHPIDVVAPGSIKMFQNDDGTLMKKYQNTFPGTTAMNKTDDGTVEILDKDGNKVPSADVLIQDARYGVRNSSGEPTGDIAAANPRHIAFGKIIRPGGIPSGETTRKYSSVQSTTIQTGKKKSVVLGLDDDPEYQDGTPVGGAAARYTGNQILISGDPATGITLDSENSHDNITWSALLAALANDQGVDILADRLKSIKNNLIRPLTTSASGGPYIEFGPNESSVSGKPLRLYISNVEPDPSDVPVGSIGIGWGFNYTDD